MDSYFLDTYALIEIIKGNNNYSKYLTKEIYTTIMNLYELYYSLFRDYGKDTARKYFNLFKKIIINFNDENIFSASEFKLSNREKRISYTDALGYAIALNKMSKFVTGDKAFRGVNNVEFVK